MESDKRPFRFTFSSPAYHTCFCLIFNFSSGNSDGREIAHTHE